MEAKIRKLGTLYSGSEMIGSENSLAYSKDDHPRDLIIRDTVPGLESTWVEYDGLLMARYPVLCKISFDDLKFAGLIQGKQVQIDGVRYELRLLRGGLRDYPSSDDLWVREVRNVAEGIWRNADFRCWGYRSPAPGSYSFDGVLTALTDSDSPIWTAVLPTDTRTETIGWRPVLEPVFEDPESLPSGAEVFVRFSGGELVTGSLKEVNDYDIVLSDSNGYGKEGACRHIGDHVLCIDRNAIQELRRMRRYGDGGRSGMRKMSGSICPQEE